MLVIFTPTSIKITSRWDATENLLLVKKSKCRKTQNMKVKRASRGIKDTKKIELKE